LVHACEAIFPSWTATRLHAFFIVSVRVWHHIWMAEKIYSVLFCHALLGFRVVVIIDDTSSFRLRSASQASYASSTPDDASRWCHPVCQSRYPRDTYSYMFQPGYSRFGCGICTLASFVPACFFSHSLGSKASRHAKLCSIARHATWEHGRYFPLLCSAPRLRFCLCSAGVGFLLPHRSFGLSLFWDSMNHSLGSHQKRLKTLSGHDRD
jgi:hypothetical protein